MLAEMPAKGGGMYKFTEAKQFVDTVHRLAVAANPVGHRQADDGIFASNVRDVLKVVLEDMPESHRLDMIRELVMHTAMVYKAADSVEELQLCVERVQDQIRAMANRMPESVRADASHLLSLAAHLEEAIAKTERFLPSEPGYEARKAAEDEDGLPF
jgi:hypothetical protein